MIFTAISWLLLFHLGTVVQALQQIRLDDRADVTHNPGRHTTVAHAVSMNANGALNVLSVPEQSLGEEKQLAQHGHPWEKYGLKTASVVHDDRPLRLGGAEREVLFRQEGEDVILPGDGEVKNSVETVVTCVPEGLEFDMPKFSNRARDRSCKFSNLYRDVKGFMVLLVNGSASHRKLIDAKTQYCVTPHARRPVVCPRVKVYDTYESLKSDVLTWKTTMYHRYFPDLTLHFDWACPSNPAHSLWDDLYPAYVALNKFGLENKTFLPYIEAAIADCGWGMYTTNPSPNNTNPEPGEMVHIQMSDRSEMEPYGHLPLNSQSKSYMIWQSWRSIQSFGWREAKFIGRFNRSHSLVEVSCDQKSLLVSEVQACKGLLSSKHDKPHLLLKVPSDWLKVKQERNKAPMEQVIADFGAKRQNGEALNHYELNHHVVGDYFLQFETVVMGTGDGNMLLTPEVAIGGSRGPHWAMRKFRDRMLDVYNVTRRSSVRTGHDVRVLFIVNKRFDRKDGDQIEKAIKVLKAEHSIQADSKYLDYTTEPSFQEQLETVHGSDIYVSGPGTGMLNAPFLPDRGAVINLGAWTVIEGSIVPAIMEQQTVGGGTPYLHVLFRNFSESSQAFHDMPKVTSYPAGYHGDIIGANLSSTDIVELVLKAKDRMIHGTVSIWEDRGNIEDNLSLEGVVFRKACKTEPDRCLKFLRARNFGPCQTFPEMWYELMVYEVYEHIYNICSLNHTLVSSLRKSHGLHQFGKAPALVATLPWKGGVV